jgi:hypothetical protein
MIHDPIAPQKLNAVRRANMLNAMRAVLEHRRNCTRANYYLHFNLRDLSDSGVITWDAAIDAESYITRAIYPAREVEGWLEMCVPGCREGMTTDEWTQQVFEYTNRWLEYMVS